MKYAILLKAEGFPVKVTPKNGTDFTLEELQSFVGGLVEILTLPSGKIMVCNDESKLCDPIDFNVTATAIWYKEFPRFRYQHLPGDFIAGDVLLADPDLIR